MNNSRLDIRSVSFTYEEAAEPALTDVSMEAHHGEFIAVLGHNGSGKSTLAKLINALYLPTNGTVYVCNMDTKDENCLWDIRRRAGMIFQNPDNQIVATVVKEDVAFGLENLGVPHDEMLSRIESSLARVGMTEYADTEPHMLSGGQKQRVAIAGVLAMEPSCLIADEATAMLDPSGCKEVLDTVRTLVREKNITVVWITHFMEEAVNADKVVVIDHGHVAMQGKPREVFQQVDRLRELHLDVPVMTSLAKSLAEEGMKISRDVMTLEEMAEEVEKALCLSK